MLGLPGTWAVAAVTCVLAYVLYTLLAAWQPHAAPGPPHIASASPSVPPVYGARPRQRRITRAVGALTRWARPIVAITIAPIIWLAAALRPEAVRHLLWQLYRSYRLTDPRRKAHHRRSRRGSQPPRASLGADASRSISTTASSLAGVGPFHPYDTSSSMHTSPIWTAVRADGARPSHVDAARRALPYTAASQPSPSVQASSQRHRHSTIPPNLPPVRRRRKTLVLDLDETLIHSTARSARGYEHTIEVMLGKHVCLYFVFKRPFCDYFLQKVSSWYDVVIFTASMPEYADPVIDWLDKGRTMVQRRMFRNACTLHNGTYVKDLEQINSDLSQICLLDNSPISYALQQDNGIPIDDWTQDPNDEALLDLLPFLEALRFTDDVRSILSLRT